MKTGLFFIFIMSVASCSSDKYYTAGEERYYAPSIEKDGEYHWVKDDSILWNDNDYTLIVDDDEIQTIDPTEENLIVDVICPEQFGKTILVMKNPNKVFNLHCLAYKDFGDPYWYVLSSNNKYFFIKKDSLNWLPDTIYLEPDFYRCVGENGHRQDTLIRNRR